MERYDFRHIDPAKCLKEAVKKGTSPAFIIKGSNGLSPVSKYDKWCCFPARIALFWYPCKIKFSKKIL
jgi:hypothetical protein